MSQCPEIGKFNLFKYDKWFGEPLLIGLTGRYGHSNEKS